MDDAPRGKLTAGDPAIVPLEDWNRVRAEMLRLLGLGAVAPLAWSWEGGRRSLVDTRPDGLWAKLAGSSSPYTATEQVRDPATLAWVDGARALTNVVEVNGGSGLANTVEFVESGAPGEWLFQAVKLGAAPVTGLTCSPCAIPLRNLFLTSYWTCAGTPTTTTYTLTWNGVTTAGSARWTSGCVALPCSRGPFPVVTHARYTFSCTGGGSTALLTGDYFTNVTNCTNNTSVAITEQYPGTGWGGSFGSTLTSIGDCVFFDLEARAGGVTYHVVSE